MKLKETVDLMLSNDYKERFKAEYLQLKIRYEKLKIMCEKWDNGDLNFKPTCPRYIYDRQLKVMKDYIDILYDRMRIEGIYIIEDDKTFIADVKEFNTLIINALRRQGYIYLEDLKGFDYASIQRIRGIGKKSANIIMNKLEDTFYPAILWE